MSDSPAAQLNQVLLRLHYQDLVHRGAPLPALHDVEFRCHSQNGEDGILLFLMSVIGTSSRRVVEICAGDGIECNAANLIINHGWQGLLFDGDADQVARGQEFYRTAPNTRMSPPSFINAWITAETIDALVIKHGFSGEVDLLSLDLDGNDYWILKALTSVQRNVIVLEFNAGCGPVRSVSMSYREDYRLNLQQMPYRCGASLAAFTKLTKARGYRLVGVQSLGFNAFFVKNGLADVLLPERTPEEIYRTSPRLVRHWHQTQLDGILAGPEPWEEV